MRFGILGRLLVMGADGSPIDIGGTQPRLIAAALVAADGRALTSDFLVDAIWGDDPPSSPTGSLQTYVSRLRRHVGAEALVWEAPGYRLVVGRDDVDAWRFERLAAEGRAALDANDPATARRALLDADALWRGSALPEVREIDPFRGVASRLEERRLVAVEDRFEAELALGRHELVVGELAEAVIAQPFREGLRAQLALALYRSGRQAEALRSISSARTTFGDELGLDLGAELRQLESSILDHDPALDLRVEPAKAVARSRRPVERPVAPLVGRKPELDILTSAFDAAASSLVSVIVEGQPGVGKTRLIEEFVADAALAGATVAWGAGYEGPVAPSWWPWLNVLGSLTRSCPESASAELEELLQPSGSAGADVSPSRRFELHEAVRRSLETAAGSAPLVIVLDDLQWADTASLELLAHLTRTIQTPGTLIVVMLRELEVGLSSELTHTLGVLSRVSDCRRIHLGGLTESEIIAVLNHTVDADLPTEVTATINRRAEGNPFFAIELVRDYHEGGVQWAEQPSACTVPAGLADVVRQRLDRLPPAARHLLHVAAVIGRDVDSALLLRAADREADAFDDLEPAFAQRFLDEMPASPGRFRFNHALVRDVLLNEITTLQEARLHLRVADAIEARADLSETDIEVVAEHLYAARSLGVGHRAAVALRTAAAVAIRRTAYSRAEDMLDRAALLLLTAEGVPDRANAELDVLVALFFAQRATRGHDVAILRPPYQRARELAASTKRIDVTARLLWAEWVGVDKTCDNEVSRRLATELRQMAIDTGDPMIEGLSLHASGVLHWHAGRLAAAISDLDRAADLNRAWASTSRAAVQAMVAPVSPSAWPRGHPIVTFLHVLIGDIDDPVGEFERMAADELQPFGSTVVWMFAAFGALAIGDVDAAVESGRRGLDTDPDLVFTYWGPGAHMALGAALVAGGDVDAGLEVVAKAMPRYLASGTRLFVPLVHARVAQGLAAAGRHAEADVQITRARALIEEYDEVWLQPVIDAVEAEMAAWRGGMTEAIGRRFDDAVERASEHGGHAIAAGIAATWRRLSGR